VINWVYFPKSSPPPEFGLRIVAGFEEVADAIDSSTTVDQHSNTVMARLRPSLEKMGFRVEKGKSIEGKIVVPVLFGRKGKVLKCFNADAHAVSMGWVLEVEAGRAVDTLYTVSPDILYTFARAQRARECSLRCHGRRWMSGSSALALW
jgi:hypothetical protein